MKQLFYLSLCLLTWPCIAQDDLSEKLNMLLNEQKFDEVINSYSNSNGYSSNELYLIGMAYYMKSDDPNCLELMDLSIAKDSTNSKPYFIKGMTYNFMEKFDNGIKYFNKAIELNPEDSHYHTGLGDAYLNKNQLELALTSYKNAIEQENSDDRPYTMIPQIYADMEQPEKALEAFYQSKANISKESESYIITLYNIGLYESLKRNYDSAELAYKELLEIAPNDFHSYAKLIQVYYGKKEYDKAIPLKETLYQAYNDGILEGDLEDMFCFDQFDWNDKLIQVFERFAVKKGKLYYKHLFYVVNDKNEIEFRIQTENAPVSIELGGPKYVLGMDKDGVHSTFRYGFEEDFDYEDLKKTVILVLEDKIKPGASSRVNKN